MTEPVATDPKLMLSGLVLKGEPNLPAKLLLISSMINWKAANSEALLLAVGDWKVIVKPTVVSDTHLVATRE